MLSAFSPAGWMTLGLEDRAKDGKGVYIKKDIVVSIFNILYDIIQHVR